MSKKHAKTVSRFDAMQQYLYLEHFVKKDNTLSFQQRLSIKIKNYSRGVLSTLQLWPDTSSRMKELFLNRTDSEALYQDWQYVGSYIRNASRKYEHDKAET